jgi:hypothetical protein
MSLIISILVVFTVFWYLKKYMNLGREDECKFWCGYFLIEVCRDIATIIMGILTMSSSTIITGLVGALIAGVFLWYFAKSAKLI